MLTENQSNRGYFDEGLSNTGLSNIICISFVALATLLVNVASFIYFLMCIVIDGISSVLTQYLLLIQNATSLILNKSFIILELVVIEGKYPQGLQRNT